MKKRKDRREKELEREREREKCYREREMLHREREKCYREILIKREIGRETKKRKDNRGIERGKRKYSNRLDTSFPIYQI